MTEQIASSVFVVSNETPTTPEVKGYDFNLGVNWQKMLDGYVNIGFQATHFSQAVDEVNRMLEARSTVDGNLSSSEIDEPRGCRIFLGYTSNMVSSGVRDIIRFLVEHKMVDCIVTTCGGIEEDFIKCMANTYIGDFRYPGNELRRKGWNRIGNLVIPNKNYCMFSDWLLPILDAMVEEQKTKGIVWSPSSFISRLGKEINNPESIYYWAWKNNIPVFCPGITDGSIGDIVYYHTYQKEGLILDLVQDIRAINNLAQFAPKSDYAVFINTGHEFDGSDAGASPDEAVSWGKIKMTAKPVKICADATLVFPLLVGQTFAKFYEKHSLLKKQ